MDPFIGEVKAVAFNYAPRDWALCYGQMMPISQNQALYALLGTRYGGDGVTNFALPDLRGRTIVGQGQGPGLPDFYLGTRFGQVSVTLTEENLPAHTHSASLTGNATGTFSQDASTTGATDQSPAGKIPAASQTADARPAAIKSYIDSSKKNTQMAETSVEIDLSGTHLEITNTGGGQPVNNMPPFLVLNYIIAIQGIFPPRS